MSLANSVTGGWKFIPFGIGFPITGKFLSKPSLASNAEADAAKKLGYRSHKYIQKIS